MVKLINGVIHAACLPGGGLIQQKTREIAEKVMAPKVRGGASQNGHK
ncbi:MAG: KR domain-containing protein [Hormoscilla sp. GUM202]|nr:KR domain-containing protein [Hormoscilla sp. GUM202]